MIMEIKRNIADNHVSAYAAQAAYFIMLSLIPLLILLLSMIQFTGIGKADFYSPAFGAAGLPKLDVEYY